MTPLDIQLEESIERTKWSNHFYLDVCEHGEQIANCDQDCGTIELHAEISSLRGLVTTLRTMVRERDEAYAKSTTPTAQ